MTKLFLLGRSFVIDSFWNHSGSLYMTHCVHRKISWLNPVFSFTKNFLRSSLVTGLPRYQDSHGHCGIQACKELYMLYISSKGCSNGMIFLTWSKIVFSLHLSISFSSTSKQRPHYLLHLNPISNYLLWHLYWIYTFHKLITLWHVLSQDIQEN